MGLSALHKLRTMKKKKNIDGEGAKCNRFLITVTVFGSSGPIRFVVKGDDNATAVIGETLRIYAREGRLPVLGSDAGSFLLYPAHAGFVEAMSPTESIGWRGERSFVLSKKERKPHMTEGRSEIVDGKGRGWRVWLHKSLSLKILSH